jgi:hypothetical protein
VSLYFGGTSLSGYTLYLAFSTNSLPQFGSGDFYYSPGFSPTSVNSSSVSTLKGSGGVWTMGNNWVNGSIPRNVQPGNYYIKVCNDQNQQVITTDTYISVFVLATLQVSPASGPGDVQVQFMGSGFPAAQPVTISYFDNVAGWGYLRSVTADAVGQISFSEIMPDLGKSLGSGDYIEASNQQSFKAELGGHVAYADYNQMLRGIKSIGDQTAQSVNGLFGNGTYIGTYIRVGDVVPVSGKWFHPNDVIYIRWDGATVVGTVTGNQWSNAAIIGSSISDSAGSFFTTITVPIADEGQHFLSIEDSQVRFIISIYMSSAYLFLSPSSGPGGSSVQFSGTSYPPSSSITISYKDPTYGTWSPLSVTTSDSAGRIEFNVEMPDLRKSLSSYDSSETTYPISFRTESQGKVYCYATYNEYARGLKTVGGQTANGLFGNGTNLASTVTVLPGNSLTITGIWFHPNDVVYVRWDGSAVVGTVTGDQWRNARLRGHL